MKALDYLFALLALAALVAFLGVLAYRVPHIDLIIVCAIGVLMAAYDFFAEARRRAR